MGDYRQQQVLQEEEEYIEMERIEALKKLREPFLPHQISKLPKPYKRDSTKGKCAECGGYHGLPAMHLDYVGHAALTDRLLDVDPLWTWEPLAFDSNGLPAMDKNGGMWGRLTICGVTRIGYGDAGDKAGGDAIKEIVGDFLRNAAMRFGAALDLWHKGDLHPEDEKPSLKHTPNDGAGDSLSSDKKNLIADTATAIKDAYEDNDANKIASLYNPIQDNDERLFLWSLLDSKIRSTITSYRAIFTAKSLDDLKVAWEATPKHAHTLLLAPKDGRKNQLNSINGTGE